MLDITKGICMGGLQQGMADARSGLCRQIFRLLDVTSALLECL